MPHAPTGLPEHPDLLCLLADHVDDALLICDERQQITFISRACSEMLEIPIDLANTYRLFARVHDEDRPQFSSALASAESAQRVRVRFALDDGQSWQRIEMRVQPTRVATIVRFVPIEIETPDDVSRLEAIARGAADLITDIDDQGTILWTRGSEDHALSPISSGGSIAEAIESVHPDDRKKAIQQLESAWRRDEPMCCEFRVQDRYEEWRWVQATVIRYRNSDGDRRYLALTRDISESRKILEQLSSSEERYRLLAVHGHDMISEHDSNGRLIYANEQALAGTGYTLEELDEIHPLDNIHPDDLARVAKMYQRVFEQGERVADTYRGRNRDDTWSWYEASAHMHRAADGTNRVVTLTRDVTGRKQAEQALQESEERYRQLVERSPEAIGVVYEGPGGVIAYANQAGAQLMGHCDPQALIGRALIDFITPATLRVTPVEGDPNETPELEMEIRRPDGKLRQMVMTGTPISYEGKPAIQGLARDVTEQRQAQRDRDRLRSQLEETRRLESLGVLAGGIAHDFNNLLTVVLANTRFVRDEDFGDEETQSALDDALDAAESAARLTRQLLAYAGRREPEVRSVDLSAHARSVNHLLRSAVPKTVSLTLDLEEGLPSVHADAVQLEQVIMNLVLNAVEAVGDGAGDVRVATRTSEIGAEEISTWIASEGLEPGRYVCLEVSDTGCGIDADTLTRIFDPFFTTKVQGHGLGLSTVLGLVRGHAGGVAIDSRTDSGTTIRVFLPSS